MLLSATDPALLIPVVLIELHAQSKRQKLLQAIEQKERHAQPKRKKEEGEEEEEKEEEGPKATVLSTACARRAGAAGREPLLTLRALLSCAFSLPCSL
jgi:hypothetical protein